MSAVTPEQLAQFFHETYERLAPNFSYEIRKASAVPWSDVPENNKLFMIAVAGEVLKHLEAERLEVQRQQRDYRLWKQSHQ